MLAAQQKYDEDPTVDNQQVLSKAKDDLINMQAQEETYWRQKAHVKWLLEGDRNTQYFNSVVQQKRSSTFIKELEDAQGNLVSDSSHIPKGITDYYQSLFSSQVTAEDSALLDLIPSIITSEHNSMLLAPPSIEEVREVVFGLSADCAPEPDDFSGHFFRACWEIVCNDVHAAVLEFFRRPSFPRAYTSTFLVLLPKVTHAKAILNLIPLRASCCLAAFSGASSEIGGICTGLLAFFCSLNSPSGKSIQDQFLSLTVLSLESRIFHAHIV